MKKPSLRIIGYAVALAMLLAGCTSAAEPGSAPAGSATPSPEVEPDPEASTPEATPIEEEDPAEEFEADATVLAVAVPEPSTLDPMRIKDPGSTLIARQLFEGLTRWDPQQEAVVPAAAQRWAVTDKGSTFTFTLREGTAFHDGTPVTSHDFKYAFERMALRKNASDLAYTLDRVKGFLQVNQLGGRKRLSGVSTPDKSTLVIRLSEPYYDFPAVLTHPGLVPVPRDAVEDLDTFLTSPVGNGPFKMAREWNPGEPVVLEAFEDFALGRPELDGITFEPVVDAAQAWLSFDRGDIDVAEVPIGQFSYAAGKYGDQGYQPFLAGYYFGLNMRSGALRNARAREAINLAINREAIAQDIYRGSMAEPRGIIPSGMPGFEENLCASLCAFQPERARRLVNRLPKANRNVQLDYTEGSPHGQVARAVKRDLLRAGFRVSMRGYPFRRFLQRLISGRGGVYRLGWIAEYPAPDVFLSSLFDSASPDNHSGFDSAKVDSLLDRAHRQSDPERRLDLYQKAERAIMERTPVVPIGTFMTHWAAQSNVEGIEFDPMGGFDAAGISVER
jgi:oligopeptide transport system substrate-binding protein